MPRNLAEALRGRRPRCTAAPALIWLVTFKLRALRRVRYVNVLCEGLPEGGSLSRGIPSLFRSL